MKPTSRSRPLLRQGLLIAGGMLVALALAPVFLLVAVAVRLVLLGALAVAAVALVMSPAFRRWLQAESEASVAYLGVRFPEREALLPSHGWLRPEAGRQLTVGVDDLVQRIFGPVEAVLLPIAGQWVDEGEPLFGLRRGTRTLTVKAPVAGLVAATNPALARRPGLVNEAPFGAGWAVAIAPRNASATRRLVASLPRARHARAFMRAEVDRLLASIGSPMAGLAQDGGTLVGELHEVIDDASWELIRAEFFGDHR